MKALTITPSGREPSSLYDRLQILPLDRLAFELPNASPGTEDRLEDIGFWITPSTGRLDEFRSVKRRKFRSIDRTDGLAMPAQNATIRVGHACRALPLFKNTTHAKRNAQSAGRALFFIDTNQLHGLFFLL